MIAPIVVDYNTRMNIRSVFASLGINKNISYINYITPQQHLYPWDGSKHSQIRAVKND